MLDIKLLREDTETVKAGLKAKNADPALVDDFLESDNNWREFRVKLDELRAKQNKLSKERNVEEAKKNKEEIKAAELEITELEKERDEAWMKIPNLPLPEVPQGFNESENKVLREVGKKTEFTFKPKDHLELGEALGIIDFASGAKVAGSGFYYLKNDGALLELALVQYALDFLRKKGFDLWLTPDLAKDKFYLGTGYNPRGPEAQTYLVADSDLGLIATAEVTLAAIHADEVLQEKDLPKRYAGYSHCFRQEGGAYGKYSRGLYRVHQFTKVEMFAYAKPAESPAIHEELLALEEELWQSLGIPYRVLEMCAGDLGAMAARKFDLEAWMPGRGDYGEVTSTSNTTDYQARRLNIKYKGQTADKPEFVHTLNGTAIATSRGIIAVLENYQREDGKIDVPEALQKYFGKKVIG
ncbi:MAG: serine--tRNA ligase [Patescibacteria group bacterium]|nr:serine--tRNA ligase [Patescibacteria group bacterium]MDE2014974.1 serine--tRNA ligase [Patescibacteria group bacterium]MDE2226403.1 serine--tRNA ligase [Patescibacteria group bacterium]